MEEDKKLVEALTRRLGEAAKEYAELEVRFHACLDKCARLEEHLKENAKASEVGKRISHNEHPILTTGVSIGCLDFSALSQGRVYSLFYDDGGERKELYFAPKAYYPAERLLECYFVIGTKGDHFEQAFIPEWLHGRRCYNSIARPFPDWAQQRDFMLALDYDDMNIIVFFREDEIARIKALVEKINPQRQLLDAVIPGMKGAKSLRLIVPDFEHSKKKYHPHNARRKSRNKNLN